MIQCSSAHYQSTLLCSDWMSSCVVGSAHSYSWLLYILHKLDFKCLFFSQQFSFNQVFRIHLGHLAGYLEWCVTCWSMSWVWISAVNLDICHDHMWLEVSKCQFSLNLCTHVSLRLIYLLYLQLTTWKTCVHIEMKILDSPVFTTLEWDTPTWALTWPLHFWPEKTTCNVVCLHYV